MDSSQNLVDDSEQLPKTESTCLMSSESKNDILSTSIDHKEQDTAGSTVHKEKQDSDKTNAIKDVTDEVDIKDTDITISHIKIENTSEDDPKDTVVLSTDMESSNQIELKKEQEDNDLTEDTLMNTDTVEDSHEDSTTEIAEKNVSNIKRKRKTLSTQESALSSEENGVRSKRKKLKNVSDKFCWRCHKESVEAHCSACPRSWHRRCMGGSPPTSIHNWICGECATILKAENAETRSIAMAQLSVDQLCMLLKHVVHRMREYPGSEPFTKPVELSETPNYLDYVVKPMDLNLLESNVRAKLYGSTDAFMSDAKWIQHNCIVYNTCGGVYADTSKLTNTAKQIIKVARQEVSEIEACPDCYAHARNLFRPQPSWFIEPCRQPHPLVWAKLKGFPFWPAKAMPRLNSQGFVDVRFFGEHDRAWIPPRDLYLYSEDPPAPLPRKRKVDMDECVREITRHCRKLELVFGKFKFAPPKVQYNPHDPMQIKLMLPNYDPLHPNNFMSSQFLIPKKKAVFRKRNTSIKDKTQTDISTTQSTVIDKALNSDQAIHPDENKNKSKVQKTQKISMPDQSSSKSENVDSDLLQNELQKTIMQIKNETPIESTLMPTIEENESMESDRNSIEKNNANVQKSNEFTISPSKNNLQMTQDNVTSAEEISTQNELLKVEHALKRHSNAKTTANRSNSSSTSDVSKVPCRPVKSSAKVYKPKTRLVDKLNAEKALKSLSENEQKEKTGLILSSLEPIIQITTPVLQNDKNNLVNEKTANATITTSLTAISPNNTLCPTHCATTTRSSLTNLTGDQSKNAINSVSISTLKQSTSIADKESVLKPGFKEQKRESKARKSFPNKPPTYPQITLHSSSNTLPTSTESMNYISTQQKEHSIGYQLIPPEAGPLSARLYHGAEELAKRMAQLMEEAYKEAAHNSQNSEDDSSDKHHATVHFLRLQIERMRWQHQQQLAELKHNTDRMLREMRASLEAERLRAVEETRREAEQEKIRSIEETKRKQWCAMCHREALFYCCWNTAYCDYACQQSHWPTHMRTCAQKPFTTIMTTTVGSHQQQNVNSKVCNPACRVYSLPHSKSPGLPTSHYVSCSKNESN